MSSKGNIAQSLIVLMIAIVIGVSVVMTIATDVGTQMGSTYTVTNESRTYVAATQTSLSHDHIVVGTFVLSNAANGTIPEQTGVYSVDEWTGKITVQNNASYIDILTANSSYGWRYPYYSTGTNKTLVLLLPILIAVVLVLAAVGLMGFGGSNKRR